MDWTGTGQAQRADRCPICGGDNQCAMTANDSTGDCWCRRVTFSAQALASVPAEAVGKCCLCPVCARGKGETDHAR